MDGIVSRGGREKKGRKRKKEEKKKNKRSTTSTLLIPDEVNAFTPRFPKHTFSKLAKVTLI
jgi:hypothetical protein